VDRRSGHSLRTTEKVLSTPPVLVAPKEKEPLLLYIAATHQVVSTVLVVERSEEGKAHGFQQPVYFVSEVLSPTKQRYPHYQKLAYSVFTTTQKLRQYFAVHPIVVVNEAPLSNILNNPSATGRVSLWGIELSPLDITYEKRKAIKSQLLPDFTAEWLELQNIGPPDLSSVWTMYFDGSKRIQGAGAGVVLISPQGNKLKYVLRMSFPQASSNEAEYEALLHGMKMAKACGATRLKIFGDSNLVVQQVMNKCDAISDNMTAYRNLYYYLEGTFDGCEVTHVSRASNEEADTLANIGSQCLPIPQGVFWEEIIERSIKSSKVSTAGEQVQSQTNGSGADNRGTTEPEEVMMIEETWMQPYLAYMVNKTLPEDMVQAKKNNMTIQGFRRVTRKTIQEKYNRRSATMRYSLMRYGVDCFSPSSWEPQEEGMMNIAARFSLSKKPRFMDPKGKEPND
jgi:ribonuclease HI